jgi:hypothetical protein
MNIGCIYAFVKSYTNTPELGIEFVECNGQRISDATSPLNNMLTPNLNTRFLRGATASGSIGGAASSAHTHGVIERARTQPLGETFGKVVDGTTVDTLPPYYNVVWVMKIK